MEEETSIIKKIAKLEGVSKTWVISEITSIIQRSETPNHICGMRSKNVLKVALWREKRKVNTTPPIPLSGDFASFNADKDFLKRKCWTKEEEEEAVLVYKSDTGAQVLRTH